MVSGGRERSLTCTWRGVSYLPRGRSYPFDQRTNNLTLRHPLNTFTPLFYIGRLRWLSFTDRAYIPRLTAFERQTDRQSLSFEMSSFAAVPADRGKKRYTDEELDAPAPKLTRTEGKDEKDTLKSKLEKAFAQDTLLSIMLKKLDNIVAPAFCDTETQLQPEDAEQLVVYLSVSLQYYCHDR